MGRCGEEELRRQEVEVEVEDAAPTAISQLRDGPCARVEEMEAVLVEGVKE